jgi:hypothetical protein
VRRRTHIPHTMSAALLTNVDQKLLRKTKFPPEFDQKVNMEKVNVPVIKKWVADEIARILQNDDDIVTEMIYNVLEESPYVGDLQPSKDTFTRGELKLMHSAAEDQRAADHDYWFLGKGGCAVLEVAVETAFVCSDQPSGCT